MEDTQPLHPAAAEANDIVRNKANPKHDAFWAGDKTTNEYVQSLYRKADSTTFGDDQAAVNAAFERSPLAKDFQITGAKLLLYADRMRRG
jgi:hypothetical protein